MGCWILKTKIYWGSFVAQSQLRMWNWKILSWNGVSFDLLRMLMYKFDNLHGLSIFASHPSSFVATVNLCIIMNLMRRINSIISDKYCPIKQKNDRNQKSCTPWERETRFSLLEEHSLLVPWPFPGWPPRPISVSHLFPLYDNQQLAETAYMYIDFAP